MEPPAIQRWCAARQGDMLDLLARIVDTDSATPNAPGVRAVADLLEPELRSLGAATERVPPTTPPDAAGWLLQTILPEVSDPLAIADNLVARRAGVDGAHALLVGHMDTAFPVGEAARNPFRVAGAHAFGCAVADMKAGLVVLLFAVRALHELELAAPRVTIVYNSDEQAATLTSRPLIELVVRDERVTHAFVAEMGRAQGGIVAERAALGIGRVEVSGVERHVGTGYWDAASAVRALARKVEELEALSDRDAGRVVNVGVFNGGTRRNLVPGSAVAHLDLRAATTAGWRALAADVEALVAAESLPGTSATLRCYNTRPAMERSAATQELIDVVAACAMELGQDVPFVRTTGGSDASFPAALSIPTLDGFGPVGGGTMTRDEHIVLASLPERVALLAATLHRLATAAPAPTS